ncbi:MAG: DEAD/DEAH box helicase [Verrucomicrobia bacterium]|nr:DEAD/DEAH box helicase [Verrucomicrobiota bacterium]
MAFKTKTSSDLKIPSAHDWRTTDADEINKRRLRAREESFTISNADPRHPIFSNFRVASRSGLTYSVEIRDLCERQFACDCVDFRINGLGTCKHVEAVLRQLEARFRRLFHSARQNGSTRIEVIVDPAADTLRLLNGHGELPRAAQKWFDGNGRLAQGSPEPALTALQQLRETGCPQIRISQEVAAWLENRRRAEERRQLRHEYELKVQSGEWPAHETKVPLFPYQREGMLHLAFTERALLADEMGLGKTIQAIAACALLHRLGQAQRVLVVTPASLKTEWEEQIQRFTDLPLQLVFGSRHERLKAYTVPLPVLADTLSPSDGERDGVRGVLNSQPSTLIFPFFTIVNYEQMLADGLEVNQRLRPDIVVLDEAQRIKNWSTKTTQAIKRLRSRYAFVLTGTLIENRIDELHSLMDFLNPSVLGPLFRFNREFYDLDDRGRPAAYRNLDQLHARIAPYMLRRRKAEVETELPDRTDRNHFVPLSPEQQGEYDGHEGVVARLAHLAKRRPLTQQEQDKLMRHLAMMRMVCDTNYILDPEDKVCPKLGELEKLLDECRENDAKVIVFSEWERMLELVRELCERLHLVFAWHTGTVPQRRRRAEINAFKNDPNCRVFLSTDSGSTGLNLQCASVVINCDLPWNPAKLEQRIARAWRKHQTKPVSVFNLVSEKTIEHKMLETLANKQALSDGVLDLKGDLKEIKLRTGRQAFLAKLEQLVIAKPASAAAESSQPSTLNYQQSLPADHPLGFARKARERINGALLHCEERYPSQGAHSVLYVVVDRDAAQWQTRLNELHRDFFGPGLSDPLAPVQLEVVDRATHEALERLAAAGLISVTTRASRPLFPEPETGSAPLPLSPEERAKADAHRAQAARKLKMAQLLGGGGMADETRAPLLDAALSLGRALATEARLPEPATLDEALLPPLSHCWREALPLLRTFASDAAQSWRPMFEALEKATDSTAGRTQSHRL